MEIATLEKSFIYKRRIPLRKTGWVSEGEVTWESLSLERFMDRAEVAENDIIKLQKKVHKLKVLHEQFLICPFKGLDYDDAYNTLKSDIEVLEAAITSQLSDMETLDDLHIIENNAVQEKITEDLRQDFSLQMSTLARLEECQRQRARERLRRQLSIMGRSSSVDELDAMLDQGHSPFTEKLVWDPEKIAEELRKPIAQRQDSLKKAESVDFLALGDQKNECDTGYSVKSGAKRKRLHLWKWFAHGLTAMRSAVSRNK